MKIISLNTWGGKVYKPLINFIKQQSEDTDIFCFQEVFTTTSNLKETAGFRMNLFDEISNVIKNHKGYFAASIDHYIVGKFLKSFTDFDLSAGLAIFVKKNLKVESFGDFFLYRRKNDYNLQNLNSMPKNAQYITLTAGQNRITICNVHGIWHTGGKKDTLSRIQQSQKIINFLNSQAGEKILCGDFNLDIVTKSIKTLEKYLRNLILEHSIETTRNKHYPGDGKFADYIFVSKGIKVKNFQIPNIEISDHLPMILEF